LYAKGCLPIQQCPMISIVGTRVPTEYGKQMAALFTKGLVEKGFTIVSGFARGIDQIAHDTALQEGGRTIAILGSGLSKIYPAENKKLIADMVERGTFLTEFLPSAGPEQYHFPQRNRIISGASLATVIIEARARSGALITAYSAFGQNREVFAVPGNTTQSASDGTNNLIKNGIAHMAGSVQDIIDELPAHTIPQPELTPEEQKILLLLSAKPRHINEIARMQNIPVEKIAETLTTLVLKDTITEVTANIFSITKTRK
ncbi:MAG: hypothetical protein UY05_C0029G0012, partial [Candidatus Peregrinibacteria bacterium GW2011_GWA2_47_7]